VFASLLTALSFTIVAPSSLWAHTDADDFQTKTPIKHVVVIFQENVSFDHYFGTYPHALPNTDGSVYFQKAKDDTPRVNNLVSSGLLTNNPNGPTGSSGQNPFRMDRAHAGTCDEDHAYGDEQYAFHAGLLDRFTGTKPGSTALYSCNDPFYGKFSVMGYFDGNTVTALWNYAQNFAMSDNSFSTVFGPSTPGLLSLLAGNTYGATLEANSAAGNISGGASFGTVIGDPDPFGDKCSAPTRGQVRMTVGKNVGDLLNTAGLTWGAFMGGFNSCTVTTPPLVSVPTPSADYIPHHAFFQYWNSTLNANHTPPASASMVGKTDGVTFHQYDLSWFFAALNAHNLPAVSILKAPAYEDGHAGYSDPIDEQFFLVNTINALMKSDEWKETAVIVLYDDSDGWYDHQMGPIVTQSNAPEDQLVAPGNCGVPKPIAGVIQNGRCGYGPRQPFLVISPYAKHNYVDHRVTDQSSVLRFIEDNWNLGRIGGGSTDAIAGTLNGMFDFDDQVRGPEKLLLDPNTGVVISDHDDDR
jgi:phospholipase C